MENTTKDSISLIGKKRDLGVSIPRILTFTASLDIVIQSGLSLSRIGDGELLQVSGMASSFEKGTSSVGQAIRNTLLNPKQNCLVGLNRAHYYDSKHNLPCINGYVERYWSNVTKRENHTSLFTQPFYLDACLTIPRHHYDMPVYFWDDYFAYIRSFLETKRILLVTGDKEVMESEYPMYREFCKEVRVIPCAMRGAWEERERIKADIRRLNEDGSYLVVFVCGPTATVLAWELCDEMQCLDLGHLSREYLYWRRGSNPNTDSVVFFGS